MSRIFWDTNIFIYLFEDIGEQGALADQLRQAILRRRDQLFTSALAVAELLVQPTKLGKTDVCRQYEDAIAATATVLPFAASHIRAFADIRSRSTIRAADAIQLACAAGAGIDLFITADARLQKIQVPGIQFIAPLSRAPL